MGFDLEIRLSLGICIHTGRPYYYSKNFEKNYDIESIVIPEEHRKSFEGRGKIFHVYTDNFNYENIYSVNVSKFVEEFPDWAVVREWLEENEYTNYWTDKDHYALYDALVWCEKSGHLFIVEWSY